MTRWIIRSALSAEPYPAPAARSWSAGPDLPGSAGGLGMTWDLDCDAAPAAGAGIPAEADVVSLAPVASHYVPLSGPRVKRTLLLRVRPETPATAVSQLEASLLAMPRYIVTIRSWALSRTPGSSRWTHAWEQEYEDVAGLVGEYLLHPYHWTQVDRWFDSEIPGSIVEPDLAHVFRWATDAVLPQ